MKFISIVGVMALWLGASGALKAAPPDARAVLAAMVTESERDFEGRAGEKISVNGECTFYKATPFENMIPGQQFIMKSNGLTFVMVDFGTSESRAASYEAFFSMPQFSDPRGAYTLEPDPKATNADKDVTTLLLNGRKVANFMVYRNGKDNILAVGPVGGRPAATPAATAAPAPVVAAKAADAPASGPTEEQRMQAFANGIQFLIQRAAGNFNGLVGPLFHTTAEGDPLYVTVVIADLQGASDDQLIVAFQKRNIYMKTYRGQADAAFAFAAFQALPKLITRDRYEVELDRRLEKPSSSTYHLRYNGTIVGDLVWKKTEAMALLSIGYRDGVPANMVMGTGRTYSQSAIDGAKRMINEGTVCANCRGVGTEEIESKYVYKGSGLPQMVTVPCHYCHGTGHL
ncbi:MAG: hypothetical protein JWM32_2749 [Verrucomicrobia bacterium]|nr:hypothetical protein [Verrucomicrobiota bacterium]